MPTRATHTPHPARYSSVVKLRMIANGRTYPLAQVSSKFVILREPTPIPPGPATVIVDVDGDERCWEVILMEPNEAGDMIDTRPAESPT